MDLNKENMKKMRELIVFTIILLIALWNYKLLFEWIGFAFGIVTPFLIGGGIAFVLNVPMSFFEETLFGNKRVKEKKLAKRLARPLSLVLTIVAVILRFKLDMKPLVNCQKKRTSPRCFRLERQYRHLYRRHSIFWKSYLQTTVKYARG